MRIVHHNQEIIHSQWVESLIKFPDVTVYPPVDDPYASLTLAELAAFGIGPSCTPVGSDHDDDDDDDDDEEEANDDEEMENDE
jgi:hypothetical protein